MYRSSDLQTCLYGLAGWRQNDNPAYETLPPSLIASASGLFFQDVHPLVNIENLDQSLKNFTQYPYPACTTGAAYVIGDRVRYATDGKLYEALVVVAVAPATLAPGDWTEVKLLSQKLEALTKASITKVASAVFTQKKLAGLTKSLFENIQLYDGVGDIMNKEMKLGRFVGFKFKFARERDIALIISRISTQFSLANPDFKLWVFSLSKSEPVRRIDLALNAASIPTWSLINNPDLVFKYLSSTYGPGDEVVIGYYEDDLVGQAINKGYNFAGAPQCSTCNNDHYFYTMYSPFIQVTPFYVSAENLEGIKPSDLAGAPVLWDINTMQPVYNKTFGLNLDLSVYCDTTDLLCGQRNLFLDALMNQVAVDAITEIAYNTRNNTIAKSTIDLAHWALQGDKDVPGLRKLLTDSLKALDFDLSSLNSICLPCAQQYGLSYTSY